MDEEHDGSFKQTEGFCYSARDLRSDPRAPARRAGRAGFSDAIALETYANAKSGRYDLLDLPQRINTRPPTIDCIALDRRHAVAGFAPELLQAIEACLARKDQALVFINRRGYAPVLTCGHCGWLSSCDRCSAQLVLHMPKPRLHCHHTADMSGACPKPARSAATPICGRWGRARNASKRH